MSTDDARSPKSEVGRALHGRQHLTDEVTGLLARGDHVLLVGPAEIGKTALIEALASPATVLDPFEHVSPRLAAQIRRAMDRGTQFIAAARTLDRRRLGAVRRIAWRFTTLHVPPLNGRPMRHLVVAECARLGLPSEQATVAWIDSILHLARGRPGVALMTVGVAARIRAATNTLPSAPAAYIEALVARNAAAVRPTGEQAVRRRQP